MDITNRTVFIAGATSGIGLELARRFAAAGSTVIVGGRRTDLLDKIAGEGFATVPIDVTDAGSVDHARDTILHSHPSLDTIVTMSGVMIPEDLRDPAHFSAAEETIDTNLLGTIRVIDAFTPHLIAHGSGTIITVSSGIGFLPFPVMPTYAASKAGVHAYSEALRAHAARDPRQGRADAPVGRARRHLRRTGRAAVAGARDAPESSAPTKRLARASPQT
jgi:uncharacterized oxidoreductase